MKIKDRVMVMVGYKRAMPDGSVSDFRGETGVIIGIDSYDGSLEISFDCLPPGHYPVPFDEKELYLVEAAP